MHECLKYINQHREAVGREPFSNLSEEEIARHERLIDENARTATTRGPANDQP